jgi:hypothetical protein
MLTLGLALLANRSSRIVLRRPGFYLAGLVCVLIVAVHLVPLLTHARPDLLGYGADSVNFSAALGRRVNWLATFAGSLVLYGSPLLIALGALALRGGLEWTGRAPTVGARVIVVATVILFGLILAMVAIGGFRFRTRYGGPLLPVGLLALFCLGGVARDAVQRFARASLAIWVVMIVGTIGLALAFERVYLRDPAPAAAAIMRTEWDRRFSCGPAYVLGHARSAHAIGLYFGRSGLGLSTGDFAEAPWVDHARLRDLGVVLVGTPQAPPPTNLLSANPTPVMTLSLPYRRTWNGTEHVYVYSFVAPQAC